jgi:hypothetical protein
LKESGEKGEATKQQCTVCGFQHLKRYNTRVCKVGLRESVESTGDNFCTEKQQKREKKTGKRREREKKTKSLIFTLENANGQEDQQTLHMNRASREPGRLGWVREAAAKSTNFWIEIRTHSYTLPRAKRTISSSINVYWVHVRNRWRKAFFPLNPSFAF